MINLRMELLGLLLNGQSLETRQEIFQKVAVAVRWHRQTLARFCAFAVAVKRLPEEDIKIVLDELDLDWRIVNVAAHAADEFFNLRRLHLKTVFQQVERLEDALLSCPKPANTALETPLDFCTGQVGNVVLTMTLEGLERHFLAIEHVTNLVRQTVTAYATLCLSLEDLAFGDPRFATALHLSPEHCRKTATVFSLLFHKEEEQQW
jgi:hypothetical protein